MKVLDYVLGLTGALILIALAKVLESSKGGTFEEMMLVMILIQVMTRGKEAK